MRLKVHNKAYVGETVVFFELSIHTRHPPPFPSPHTVRSDQRAVVTSSKASVPERSTEESKSNSPMISYTGDYRRHIFPNGVSARWAKLCQLGPLLAWRDTECE